VFCFGEWDRAPPPGRSPGSCVVCVCIVPKDALGTKIALWLGWVQMTAAVRSLYYSSKGTAAIHLLPSLGLVSAKTPRRTRRAPGRLSRKIKSFTPKKILGPGLAVVSSPPYHIQKPSHKIEKLTRAIQEPIFSVANADFEGGCDGRGCVCGTFLVICAQPSHRSTVQ
jgi:hypothetical protein